MAWNETRVMDERMSLIVAALERADAMEAICARHDVSRKTAYKWLARYREQGPAGLIDRPRAPLVHGRAMAESVAEAILELRRARPFWGPRKLRQVLLEREPALDWPAASSIGDLLRRHGLSDGRRRRQRPQRQQRPFAVVTAPNDVWCIDFKGWFRTADGTRCDPLTVTDAHTRYVLACRILPPTTEAVGSAMDKLFAQAGQPKTIRSDNGAPFAGPGAGGLSRLSVSWLRRGIAHERIDPGKPQQNGRHERFHRTLKEETARPPAASPAEQQARFDAFVHDFNENRPHEALGQQPPGRLWHLAEPPQSPVDPWYDPDHAVRRVRPTGEIKWGGRLIFVSEPLAGEPVGIAEADHGDWIIRYFDLVLGIIDHRSGRFRRCPSTPTRRAAPDPNLNQPVSPM